jgi:trehalose 6-phosphate phosphatase
MFKTASTKRYGHTENDRTFGHITTTLSPKNVPRSGTGSLELSRLSAPPLAGATADCVGALNQGPVALFLDVDGTLLDLAARPTDVVTPAGLVATLATTERRLEGALALVSGRAIDDLDRLFAPLRLRASGVHGAEMRFDPDEPAAPSPAARELPRSVWSGLRQILEAFPGAFAEDKRFSFAVHYRLAPGAERPIRDAVMRLIDSTNAVVEVVNAHDAFELKAPGWDKGGAIAAFLSTPPFSDRRPIFVGDDTTDESGFAVVAARGGLAYSVGARRSGAIGSFAGPSAVRAWLAQFAHAEDKA